ncbi:ABC transporter ATP-binding protein [Halomonas icarae]|uniref:ATP-binding cassette domain-containing protein n=1 Tax=Halomonas icarae TaxID=2691040 RepID=A0A7X4W272_9GAMM|nr:ABC transporter ATP-binding protein [Halomonas icarae]MDR5903604.1 ABC transporter ATP-binding protein [Halomonas icarae]NAW14345.1 ATP-binding cassette domain-containing protein [Halomonas icarae]
MAVDIDLHCQDLVRRFGSHTAVNQVSLEIPAGSFFSILGPSGCGKTTLLRLLAGFDRPDSGDIMIRGQRMNDVAPNHRPVNMVFQHLALFPTMSVGDNIAYGLKRRKVPTAERQRRIAEVLEQVGLAGMETRLPQQLSGGQRQRVALARCLVLKPTLLLLDEPLGALDLKLRDQMKVELKNLQKAFGTTFVYITHDQSEALVMSDRVAVMRDGRFDQVASPEALYREPATPFVASFVGDNNRLGGKLLARDGELAQVALADGRSVSGRLADSGHHPTPKIGDRAELFIRPESLVLGAAEPGHCTLTARVRATLFDGANSRVEVEAAGERCYVRLPQDGSVPAPQEGSSVTLAWEPQLARVFAAEAS